MEAQVLVPLGQALVIALGVGLGALAVLALTAIWWSWPWWWPVIGAAALGGFDSRARLGILLLSNTETPRDLAEPEAMTRTAERPGVCIVADAHTGVKVQRGTHSDRTVAVAGAAKS